MENRDRDQVIETGKRVHWNRRKETLMEHWNFGIETRILVLKQKKHRGDGTLKLWQWNRETGIETENIYTKKHCNLGIESWTQRHWNGKRTNNEHWNWETGVLKQDIDNEKETLKLEHWNRKTRTMKQQTLRNLGNKSGNRPMDIWAPKQGKQDWNWKHIDKETLKQGDTMKQDLDTESKEHWNLGTETGEILRWGNIETWALKSARSGTETIETDRRSNIETSSLKQEKQALRRRHKLGHWNSETKGIETRKNIETGRQWNRRNTLKQEDNETWKKTLRGRNIETNIKTGKQGHWIGKVRRKKLETCALKRGNRHREKGTLKLALENGSSGIETGENIENWNFDIETGNKLKRRKHWNLDIETGLIETKDTETWTRKQEKLMETKQWNLDTETGKTH